MTTGRGALRPLDPLFDNVKQTGSVAVGNTPDFPPPTPPTPPGPPVFDPMWAYIPGTAGDYISTPDAAAIDIVGDIEMVARLRPEDWSPSGLRTIASKILTNQLAYGFFVNTAATLTIFWSANGSSGLTLTSNASLAFSDGSPGWVRVTLDVNNGAGGRTARFYWAPDAGDNTEPVSWTQLGTDVTASGTTSINNSNQPLSIGASAGATTQLWGAEGGVEIARVIVRNGIAGTVVADFNAADYVAEDLSITSSTTGETWTFQGDNVMVNSAWMSMVFEGDSLTSGTSMLVPVPYPDNYPGQVRTALTPNSYGYLNNGVASKTAATMVSDTAALVAQRAGWSGPSIALLWGGTNDLYFGDSAADTIDFIESLCSGYQAAGYIVVVLTMLPRSNSGTPGTFEADRQTVNASIRANWPTYADAIADVAANTTIGQAGDETNTTYYGDLVHLTEAGYTIVAGIVLAALLTLGIA